VGKLVAAVDDIFSFFGSFVWSSENIATFPQNFVNTSGLNEFVRLNVILAPLPINRGSASGMLKVEIFTEAGQSIDRPVEIADRLNTHLENKFVGQCQFTGSSLTNIGLDENPALFKSIYTINFNFFGVS
jgi:hypothetical protein